MGGLQKKVARGASKCIEFYGESECKVQEAVVSVCSYSVKENELKRAFAVLHGVDDFHLFGFLYLLTTVFTREFYIRLNKWNKEQQSLSAIVANTARLPINEVKPDESTPEGMEIAERLYYVTGWILTSGRKRKHLSIVTVSTFLSGKKHSIPDSMPTQLVDEAQRFEGGLVYPKESFFHLCST